MICNKNSKMAYNLPSEILCQIFEYLPLSDRIQCALVSRHFCEAFRISRSSPKILENTYVVFDNDEEVSMNISIISLFKVEQLNVPNVDLFSFDITKNAYFETFSASLF